MLSTAKSAIFEESNANFTIAFDSFLFPLYG
nr:MAG TPA: hypothetical protein [Caudoviricetes sp.]DAM42030.1 MAG TPA: hypothetical protein [Caudoviricetes sp.]